MKNVKLTILGIVLFIISISICLSAYANENLSSDLDNRTITKGVGTIVSINIYEKNGVIYGEEKNSFTLGFTTVTARLYLYSSSDPDVDPSTSKLEDTNYIYDLNIGKSIFVSCKAEKGKYYRCYTSYKIDNGATIERKTNVLAYI